MAAKGAPRRAGNRKEQIKAYYSNRWAPNTLRRLMKHLTKKISGGRELRPNRLKDVDAWKALAALREAGYGIKVPEPAKTFLEENYADAGRKVA